MDMKLLLLFFIGFFVFTKLLRYVLLVKWLLGLRFKKGDFELRSSDEIASHLKELFDIYEDRLINLGFSFSHCQSIDEVVLPHSKKWNKVYYNAKERCYGCASISLMPDQNFPVNVEFITFFDDGDKLITINGRDFDFIAELPNSILVDPYAATLEEQFLAHVEKQSLLIHKTPITKLPEEYLKSEEESVSDYFKSLEDGGYVCIENGCYKLRLFAALRYGLKLIKGYNKLKAMRKNIAKLSKEQSPPIVEVPVDVEVEAFNRAGELLTPRKASIAGSLIVLLVSVLLFMVSFKVAFSMNIAMILSIVVVLFIHELGHYLGMVLFKCKDAQIFFIPLIGAATIGNHENLAPWKKIVLFLLGPAPGIFIGTCCLLIGGATQLDWLRSFGALLLILNYINLLPIVPLDGGRIFELILFSRFLFLKSVFILLSFFAFVLFAVYTGDPIVMGISFIILFSIVPAVSKNKECAKLKKKIKAENIELTKEKILPQIFIMFKQSRFNKLPFSNKRNIAKELLESLTIKPPSLGATIFSLLLYFIVLLMPLFVAISYGFLKGFLS